MDKKQFIEIIKNYFPNIQPNQIQFLDDGWDHYVYVIDNKIAFRFPRSSNHGKKDEIETKFLGNFSKISPIKVQNMKLLENKKNNIKYEMYDFISGVRFQQDLAKTFSQIELSEIAKDLGKFLTALHSSSVDEARKINMDEIVNPLDYADYWENFLKIDIEKNIFQYLSKLEQEWIKNIFKDYLVTVRKNPFKIKVTHFDLLPEHILIDPNTKKLAGIIDFSLRLSDPAYDFSYFDRYGEKFLNTVIENYSLKDNDETFLIRCKFYSARLGFTFLSQALIRDKEKFPMLLKQLHEYIKEKT